METDDFKNFDKADYKKIGPISFEINATKKYIVFARTLNTHWKFNGQSPLAGYPVNVFENNGKGVLKFVGFAKIFLGYIIAITSSVLVFIIFPFASKKFREKKFFFKN